VLDKLNLSATDREKLEKFLTYILEGYEKELGEQKIVYIEQAGLKAFGGMMTFLDGKLSPDNRMFSNAYWTLLTESEIYSSVVNQVQRPPDSLEMDEGDILLKLADMTLSIQSSLDSLSGPSIDEIIKEKCNEHYQHGNCPNLDDQFEVEVKTLVSADRASHYITDTKTFTARDIFLGKHLRYALRNHAITKITDNILRTKSAPITESIDLELKSIISKLKGNNEFKNIYITTLEDRVKAIVANNIGMDPNRPISVDLFLSGRLHPRLVICNEKIVPELVVLSHPTGLHDVYVSLKNSEVKQYPEYPTDASFEKFIRQHLSVFENAAIKPRELISYKYQLPPAYLDIHKWYKPVTSRNSKTYSNELYSTHLDKLASDLDSTVYTQAEGMRDTLLNLLRDVLMGASIVTGIATMGVSSGLGFLVLAGTSTAFAVGEVFTNKMIASETDDGAVHRAATEQAQLGIILTAVGASVDLLAIGKIVKNTVTNFKQYQAVVSTFELGSTIDKGYRSASNLISEGSIGRVYNYGNGFLIKDYNGIIKPHLTGRLVKANNNAKAMNRLYGPGSANVILDADIVNTGVKTVSVKMRRVPGESLDSILKGNEEALINEVKKQMTPDAINEIVDKLKYNGIDYNDINLGNILYDSKSKKFNIIDFDDAEILAEGARVNDPKAETMRTKFEHNFHDFRRKSTDNLNRKNINQPFETQQETQGALAIQSNLAHHSSKASKIMSRTNKYINQNKMPAAAKELMSASDKIIETNIQQLQTTTQHFLVKFLADGNAALLKHSDTAQLQELWVRRIDLALRNDLNLTPKSVNDLKTNLPRLIKKLEQFDSTSEVGIQMKRLNSALENLSTTPLTHYGRKESSYISRFEITSHGSGSTHTAGIQIRGNELFQKKVSDALVEISNTESGRVLIKALDEIGVTIQPPTMSAIIRTDEMHVLYAQNSAGGKIISFDPQNTIMGPDIARVKEMPWLERDPAIGLFHEMLHIYYNRFRSKFISTDSKITKTIAGGSSLEEESRIIGGKYLAGNGKSLFDFSNFEYIKNYLPADAKPLTENQFRRELASWRGEEVYYIRPYYGDGKSQKHLPQSTMKTSELSPPAVPK